MRELHFEDDESCQYRPGDLVCRLLMETHTHTHPSADIIIHRADSLKDYYLHLEGVFAPCPFVCLPFSGMSRKIGWLCQTHTHGWWNTDEKTQIFPLTEHTLLIFWQTSITLVHVNMFCTVNNILYSQIKGKCSKTIFRFGGKWGRKMQKPCVWSSAKNLNACKIKEKMTEEPIRQHHVIALECGCLLHATQCVVYEQ